MLIAGSHALQRDSELRSLRWFVKDIQVGTYSIIADECEVLSSVF